MKISTFTIVAGTKACNCYCPCCISKMTNSNGLDDKPQDINWRNFDIACKLSLSSGTTTALITGKGEPTLQPHLISEYVDALKANGFPLIELQTNGVIFNRAFRGQDQKWMDHLKEWYNNGMTLISLSVMHLNGDKNCQLMRANEKYDYWDIVDLLHGIGFAVRINLTVTKKLIFDEDEKISYFMRNYIQKYRTEMIIACLMDRCKARNVEQLTIRNVYMPDIVDNSIFKWVGENQYDSIPIIQNLLKQYKATELLHLGHGAIVYDVHGQNVCLNNCLTETTNPEEIRQLIFFPDGKLRYSWQYESAIII